MARVASYAALAVAIALSAAADYHPDGRPRWLPPDPSDGIRATGMAWRDARRTGDMYVFRGWDVPTLCFYLGARQCESCGTATCVDEGRLRMYNVDRLEDVPAPAHLVVFDCERAPGPGCTPVGGFPPCTVEYDCAATP